MTASESRENAINQTMTYNGGNYDTGGFFTTFTGKLINPIQPDIKQICIEDIAQALSNCCRFGGHCNQFYSVAQHSVTVSTLCDPEDALAGLLHDGSEAYLSDIVRPVKYTAQMSQYREIEATLERAIYARFGLPWPMPPSVKVADDICVVSEAIALFSPSPSWATDTLWNKYGMKTPHFTLPTTWSPKFAKSMFLRRYLELTAGVTISSSEE